MAFLRTARVRFLAYITFVLIACGTSSGGYPPYPDGVGGGNQVFAGPVGGVVANGAGAATGTGGSTATTGTTDTGGAPPTVGGITVGSLGAGGDMVGVGGAL